MDPRRWTPLTFLAPDRFIDEDPFWASFDLHSWAEDDYTWVPDPWNGFWDFARRPRDTVRSGRGDCEDFALVALSWAATNDRSGLGLAFCFEPWNPLPRHAIAYDDTHVYSSGEIEPTSVDAWLASDDRYAHVLRRRVRG